MDLFSLSLQLLVVITSDWNNVDGTLYCYERKTSDDEWQLVNSPIPVTVGKQGLAWGQGLHPPMQGPQKREGDLKAPAGIFTLGSIFCNSTHTQHCHHLPHLVIEEGLEAVDDPESKYYNQIIHRNQVSTPDWTSSERMHEVGFQYDLGLVINHNAAPIQPGKGSCIFMHIWRASYSGTAGCTAMSEQHMIELLSWLNPDHHPLLIQLPDVFKRSEGGLFFPSQLRLQFK